MSYTPIPLPFWDVASWNPDVNAARAAGEYPTAAWANQLQGLHTDTVTKVNEIGADLDAVAVSAGVVAGVHPTGSVFTAGEDGQITTTSPGTSLQVLSWDAGLPNGVAKVTALTTAWTALTLNSPIVDMSTAHSVDPLKIRVHDRRVEITGGFDTVGASGMVTLTTLAPQFRPPVKRMFVASSSISTNLYSDTLTVSVTNCRVIVLPNGDVRIPASERYVWFHNSYPLD